MLNCGAIITRSGHLNASGSIILATKGINTQRHVSTIMRSKFLRSHLLTLEALSIDSRPKPLKSIHSLYARSLGLRKIHTNLRAQCSSCATDANKRLDIAQISKNKLISDENSVGRDPEKDPNENHEETEHRIHRKKHELRFAEIEKLYPNPKGKLNDIYVSVCSQLQQQKLMTIDYKKPDSQKGLWVCSYNLKWPLNTTISAQASSKMAASKIGALKCLQYLHNDGRLKDGYPIVYDSKIVVDMIKKPTTIKMDLETRDLVEDLLDHYNSEISGLIDKSSGEKLRDISLSNVEITDPVGRSFPSSWETENMRRRNDVLREQMKFRPETASKKLPIADYREKIVTEIANNRALLIKGDTGCGKTTQVPQYIMDSFTAAGRATDCNIIVSQPRRISAMTLAERIAEERGERPGDVIGYQVRLQQVLPQTPGGILFCTTGILLKKMQSNPSLKGCSHVILDEAHERSINTDMLLVLLKRALETNPELKVIVMSATINADLFQSYFDCGVIDVPGRTYPVEMNFLDDIEGLGVRARREYVGEKELPEGPFVDCEQIADLICWIDRNKSAGAILCFLPGWADIVRVKKCIEARRQHGRRDLIVPAHSRMSYQDQRKIFAHAPMGVRKIVLATDIAETGITVTDVVYVVDSATQKAMKWHEKKGLATFDNQYASQANILQRKGRAGRVQPGTSYHMITRAQFKQLPIHPLPEVLRSSLEQTVLDCKTYSDEKADDFLSSMPEPPTRSAVIKAIQDLSELGALDENENLTALGKRMALFTVHPKLSKAIVYSSIFQCVSPMITIASAMSADSEIFTGTLYDKEAIRRIKKEYHPSSDHVSIGWLFAQWASLQERGREASKSFCWSKKLYPERMYTLSKVRDLHAENLVQCHMLKNFNEYDDLKSHFNEYSELDELVRGVLLSGLDQLLQRRDFDLRKNKVKKGTTVFIMEDGMRATVTPESVNFKRNSWPSPFLTYVRRQHSEERRTSLIRETSMVSPVTALLFSQGRIQGFKSKDFDEANPNAEIVLTIKGRKNFRLSCDADLARILLQFRDSMWNVVRYFVERQGLVENIPETDHSKIADYKDRMLQVLVQMLNSAAVDIDRPEVKKQSHQEDDEWD